MITRLTPMQYFPIKAPMWFGGQRKVGLANRNIGNHNKIEILYQRKDGERTYPEPFYISKKEIEEGLQSGEFETQEWKGVYLVLIPIDKLKLLSEVIQ